MSEELSVEKLVQLIQGGEKTLIGMLWDRIESFVHIKAKDMHAGDLTEDLEQECYFALLDAVERFDPSQGAKFLSYAGECFQGRMKSYLERKCGMYVLPSYLLNRVRQYKRFVSDFQQEYGRSPSGAEIMTAFGWSLEEYKTVLANRNTDTIRSLDAPLTDEDEDYTLGDTISADADPAGEVEEDIFQEQLRRDLWGAVDALPEQQSLALRLHYQDQKTLRDIGQELGISPEGSRQICAKGLRSLRSNRETRKKLSSYYVDIYGIATRGGVGNFMNTRMSSTERAAFIDMGEYLKNV